MSKRAVWILIVTCLAVCGGTLTAVVRVVDYPLAANEADAAEKEALEAGVPLTADDIDPPEPVPEENNAADLIQLAERRALGLPKVDWTSYISGSGRPEELQRVLRLYRSVLDDVRQAAFLPKCHFVRDLDQGVFTTYPELAIFRGHCRLLAASALQLVRQGDVDGAVQDLRAARNLATLVQQDANIITFLVALACDAVMLRSRDACMAELADRPVMLSSFTKATSFGPLPVDLAESFRRDSYSLTASLRNFRASGGIKGLSGVDDERPKQITDPQRNGKPEGMEERAYYARHLQITSKILKALKEHAQDAVAGAESADAIVKAAVKDRRLSQLMNRVALMEFGQIADAVRADRARDACSDTLARMLVFRASKGRYPRSGELTDWPIDPFDGQPIRTRIDAGRLRVYSVAANRADDQGMTRDEVGRKSGGSDDRQVPGDIVSAFPPIRTRS